MGLYTVFLLIRHKINIKGILLVSTLIILILFSNFASFTGYNPIMNEKNSTRPLNEEELEYPNSADFRVSSNITGTGVNQTVRLYMSNTSNSINSEDGYFNIPAPADNMYLTYGDFKFNFDNNFTTEYEIESASAISLSAVNNPLDEYELVSDTSVLKILNGTGKEDRFKELVDSSLLTDFNITADNGLVNFTVLANFSGDLGIRNFPPPLGGEIEFNRNNIIALILNFTYDLSADAFLTVNIWDFFTDNYETIIDNVEISSTTADHKIDKLIINENLNYTSLSNTSRIQFIFQNTTVSKFNVTLKKFAQKAIMVYELPINSYNHTALEFDLRGLNSTVNGFYAWIRTLNATKARNVKLNITLYRATGTISRDQTDEELIEPDLINGKISSISLDVGDYTGDILTYFEFDRSETDNLTRYNYFIVIKSDSAEDIFRLVTIPKSETFYGDNEVDHQLKTTGDLGINWQNARSPIYPPGDQLDASSFTLNITRGYMPSDFEIDGEKTLQVENEEFIDDRVIPYTNSPDLTWGLGQYNYDFTNPIEINGLGNFRVNLTWNMTYIKGFKFKVNYTAIAYRVENAITYYNANYDYDPEWTFNYTLDLNKLDVYKWNFTEFWFVYPNYFTAHNLTTPNGTQVFSQTGGESSVADMPGYRKVVVSTNIINTSISQRAQYDGNYSLYLTGFNAISSSGMHSYINFNGILWKTNGFMFGDNISISVDIQGPNNLAPQSGFVNVSLFYPGGTFINNLEYTNGNLTKDGTLLSYDFNNQTIYNITKDIPDQGTYHLGYFWTNDSIVGCNKIPIYIDSYDILLENCTFDNNADKYLLAGTVQLNYSTDYPYGAEMLIATVNETTGKENPDFYPVDISIPEQDGTFSYKPKYYQGHEVQVYMSNFMQNETILNPNEEINIKVTIQNRDLFLENGVNVKIDAKLVAYINDQWIIDNKTSSPINLKKQGQAGDTHEFSLNLKIPQIDNDLTWDGVNAPIRQGGAKTLIKVYIEDNYVGTYLSEDNSLLIPVEDDVYDAYILALKEPVSRRQILQYFEKDECVYLPDNCTFIANVVNRDYLSIYNLIDFSIDLKQPVKFTNVIINPENPLEGKTFNISSILSTEFDIPLDNKTINCQYYNGNSWVNITSALTDSNGFTNFEVDTSDRKIDAKVSKLFRLLWIGDNETLNGSKSKTVDIIIQTNRISLSSEDDETFVYRNTVSTIEVNLKNNGNSILKILDIDIDIDKDVDYEIKAEDNTILDWFEVGESTTIIIELEVRDIDSDEMEVKITIIAENIVSKETIIVVKTIDLDLVDKPLFDYTIEYFIFIILALIAIIGLSAFTYSRSIKKKLEIPVKEAEKARPRRGKYVKVSELKLEKPVIEEKEVEKEEEIKEVEVKKKVDLDELLEEELEPEEKPIEKVEKPPVEKPPKKIKKPPKKVKKPPKKKEKPKKGRISTREMVEKKKKKKKKKKKPPKKSKKSKPKKGLIKKKEEPKKGKKKETTDLDSLLEKEGLSDKK